MSNLSASALWTAEYWLFFNLADEKNDSKAHKGNVFFYYTFLIYLEEYFE